MVPKKHFEANKPERKIESATIDMKKDLVS